MQNKIPFSVEPDKLKRLAYNDCVYAWLLVHSFENKGEYHCYIYKNSFTFQQIAKDIHRSRQTVSRRFNELLRTEDNPFGFITEDIYCGEKVYKLPYSNPFQYLHGETVIKLLNLPLKDQKEELIKTLAYLLKKKKEAASYLHMAYELDGDAIFEDEDPVFIQLAKKQFLDLI